ncbi:MAG: sodium-extruding oxaloacetate decarboxylase subunit alpha [Psychrobium sp.]|nr:sodium-extruding oxaloacetate decarboxylase subunit alpha [Psychrobium sp.]
MSRRLGLTDVVLRDAHQSLLATRFRLEDMLPIADKLDKVGFWSLETWGGATFDSCIRYLGEDPWHRIRELKKAMPNTPQQMLLRGQNLLGYRHYADDVVTKFVERAHTNGVDVFRVFDAMNDVRNLQTAIKSVVDVGAHAQGTISYTISPVHNLQTWLDMAKRLEDMGSNSICIKDMAGLLRPFEAFELITRLKETVDLPIAMHCHATTGLSTATYQKAIEAGIDNLDTACSSMSSTYGHTATETVVAMTQGSEFDTKLDLVLLEEIAAYFRVVRKKYAKFEGSLRGVDGRILLAQVPGGMLTNMESQLKEQGAGDRMDEVLLEIPKVREDLGFIPLVTPTSQIVGTQAVLNVLTGERYKSITKETAGVLKGEYGATAAPVNRELQQKVLNGKEMITCRPADLIDDEFDKLKAELIEIANDKNITLSKEIDDDVLTYALFPQIGLKFLENRDNPSAFEPHPGKETEVIEAGTVPTTASASNERYSVSVNGQVYQVDVAASGEIGGITPVQGGVVAAAQMADPATGEPLLAPLSGNIFKVLVQPGQQVVAGEVVIILEAMKMETEVRTVNGGTVVQVITKEGDAVTVGEQLLIIGG